MANGYKEVVRKSKLAPLVNNDPLIGMLLDDRYKVVQFIGQGGMSLVYKAEHEQMERSVAIKLLKSEYTGEAANIQRFRREAQAASSLQHPNINSVYAVGVTSQGQPYLVLEFLDGKSLAMLLQQEKPLELKRAVRLFMQVLDGLEQAHARGVVHRDLKPSNIMITQDLDGAEIVKIVDFGTAKLMPVAQSAQQQLTQAGEVLGTLLYMAPEQKRGQQIDARADIYSVGYMLHEATEVEGRMRPELESIVQKALAEEPAQRYQSATEMRAALERVVAETPVALTAATTANTPPALVAAARRPHKKPIMLGLIAVLVALLFASSLIVISRPTWHQELSYRWLKITNADPERLIASADAWAQAVLDRNENYADALAIYHNYAEPLFPRVSLLARGRALYGIGRTYCLMNDLDSARKVDRELEPVIAALKSEGKTTERNTLFLCRCKLETLADTTGPISNTKLMNLKDVAHKLEKHDMFEEAENVYKLAIDFASKSSTYDPAQAELLSNYIELCDRLGQKDKTLAINEQLYALIEKHGGANCESALVLVRHGELLMANGDMREADVAFHQAQELMGDKHPALPRLWVDLGSLCKKRARIPIALTYLLQAAKAHDSTPLAKNDFARCFTDIGWCYRRSGTESQAFPYFERVYKDLGDEALVMPECEGLADGLARCYFGAGRPDEGFKVAQTALQMAQERGIINQIQYYHAAIKIGDEYLQRNHPEKALKAALLGLSIAESNNDKAIANDMAAHCYDQMDNLREAEKYHRESASLSVNSSMNFELQMKMQAELAMNLFKQHHREEARKIASEVLGRIGSNINQPEFAELKGKMAKIMH